MIYAQPQSEGAISQLATELKNADSTKWYRRLKIVRLSMSEKPVGTIHTVPKHNWNLLDVRIKR